VEHGESSGPMSKLGIAVNNEVEGGEFSEKG